MRSSAKRPAPPSAWSWIERGMVEMSKINKALDYIEEVLVCLCLIAMTALTFGNAVLRKLGSGISFSEEISTYLFVLLSLLGSAIAAKRGAHLGLTLVTERVGAKAARILGIISMIFSTAFSALICYYGVFMAINQYEKGQVTLATQLPECIFGSFVPIGALFMTIRFGQNLYRLIAVTFWLGRKKELTRLPKASGKERWKAFKDAFWGLLMPVIILGGIYGGVFSPTDAAAVSAVYGLFVGVVIYRTIKFKQFIKLLVDSASTTATVMFITAAATLFAYVLTRGRIDAAISGALIDFAGGDKFIFLLIVNIVLLIAGCFLDSTSALYIFTPLFFPVAMALNIDPVHFGAIMIVNLAIGLVTPPVGVNLYVACGIADVSLKKISGSVVPLIIASLIVLLIVTYFEPLSLLLLGGSAA